VRIRIRLSVWLVSGCAHVFILLSVVIVPYTVKQLLSLLSSRLNNVAMCYNLISALHR